MNTRLVLWGEISTDRKALIAIYLDEATAKVHFYAFPKDELDKATQDALFIEWKKGGDFVFPENTLHWETNAGSDTILPTEIIVDRVDLILQSQHKWSKKLMSSKIHQLLDDEIHLLKEKADVLPAYDQTLWDAAKTQWEKIASYHKQNEISWEQTAALKEKINAIFDALKAIKRLDHENEDQANSILIKSYLNRIEELQAKIIYNDQWKAIIDELKKIQTELKEIPMRWADKRKIYTKINNIFDDLKNYKSADFIAKTEERIRQLTKIANGIRTAVQRDSNNFSSQVEKLQHYTKGKLSAEELKSRFGFVADKNNEKSQKLAGIEQTIAQLKKEIEKAQKQKINKQAVQTHNEENNHPIQETNTTQLENKKSEQATE